MSKVNPVHEALRAAFAARDVAAMQALLGQHPQASELRDAQGVSLLMLALYHGQAEIAELLARYRSDIDLFEVAALGRVQALASRLALDPSAAQARSPDGFPVLALAVFFGKLDAAAVLLAHGADVDAAAGNAMRVAPVHAAAAQADPRRALRLMHLLLAYGVDVRARQQGGWTALHSAAHRDHAQLVSLLRLAGADATVPADDGRSAIDLARSEGKAAALAALQ